MRHIVDGDTLIIEREEGDKQKYYNESSLLYAVKTHLNTHGYDLVKRITTKDGHLYGDDQTYYLRDRKWRYCFVDDSYMLRFLYEDWNQYGHISLSRHDF